MTQKHEMDFFLYISYKELDLMPINKLLFFFFSLSLSLMRLGVPKLIVINIALYIYISNIREKHIRNLITSYFSYCSEVSTGHQRVWAEQSVNRVQETGQSYSWIYCSRCRYTWLLRPGSAGWLGQAHSFSLCLHTV